MLSRDLIGNVVDASAGGGSALGGTSQVLEKRKLVQLFAQAGAVAVTFTIQESIDGGTTWTNVFSPITIPANSFIFVDLKKEVQKPSSGGSKLLRLFASSAAASTASGSLIGYEEEQISA